MCRTKVLMDFSAQTVSNPNRHSSGSPAPLQMELLKLITCGLTAVAAEAGAEGMQVLPRLLP